MLFQEHRQREVLGCATCFCCRVNTHTTCRATLLSHRFATIPQSLEICLPMRKIQSFLNSTQWAAVERGGVSRTCNGFAFSHLLIRTCHWAVAFVQLSLWKLFKIFEKLWKDASGCLHRRRYSALPHTHLVSQVPSTLGETTLNDNIHCWYCVGGVWDEQ